MTAPAWPDRGGHTPDWNHRDRLTAVQREEIRERYRSGETANTLALEFHVSPTWVRYLAGPRL